jgi:S-adenosylmethionine:tRNA ribosyltransferase-isomerase
MLNEIALSSRARIWALIFCPFDLKRISCAGNLLQVRIARAKKKISLTGMVSIFLLNYDKNVFTGYFCIKKSVVKIPEILIRDYNYDLPGDRIAKYPLPERDLSKLLIWKDGKLYESVFRDIDRNLPDNCLLVSNNTRVIHARLLFRRSTGARIEIFCLEPFDPSDYHMSFQQIKSVEWRCMVGNAKKWKNGILVKWVKAGEKPVLLKAEKKFRDDMDFVIRLSWDSDDTFATIIEAAGQIPIPPYLDRPSEESDDYRYQTIYASTDGSVAAPTAGLHFTEDVLKRLKEKSILFMELTLHVGAGTFQPVKSEDVAGHSMHAETVIISRELIRQLARHKGKVIAVGTTSVRSLESLYWLGLTLRQNQEPDIPPHVSQWIPYHEEELAETRKVLRIIEEYMLRFNLQNLNFSTSIIIVPGYTFHVIDGMLTNFHQPQSTLLLLIAAFLGPDWKKAYDYALMNGFRFLSYGDSNLYIKDE